MKKNIRFASLIFTFLFLISIFSVLSSLGLLIPVTRTDNDSNFNQDGMINREDPFTIHDLGGAEPPIILGINPGYDNFLCSI